MRNLTHYAKRVAVFFLALLIAAGTTIMTVSAAREWFFKVISQVFPTHTQIDFTPAESLQEEIPFVAHAPEYIPDGYTMDGEPFIREPNRLVRIAYRNEDGGLIRFNQMFKGGTKVDTEDAYTETFQLNGHDALYIQKGETQMLYGYLDNALFFLYVRDPDLTKDDVLAIAFMTFFNSKKPILFPDITYSFYDVWAELFQIPYVQKPLDDHFEFVRSDYYGEKDGGGVVP